MRVTYSGKSPASPHPCPPARLHHHLLRNRGPLLPTTPGTPGTCASWTDSHSFRLNGQQSYCDTLNGLGCHFTDEEKKQDLQHITKASSRFPSESSRDSTRTPLLPTISLSSERNQFPVSSRGITGSVVGRVSLFERLAQGSNFVICCS